MAETKVLSQADIDALLAGYQADQPPTVVAQPPKVAALAPPPAPAPAARAAVPPPQPAPAPAAPKAGAKPAAPSKPRSAASAPARPDPRLDKLMARIERLEASLARIGKLEQALARIEHHLAQGGQSFGASARQHFTCPGCGTKGHVAVTLTCTSCGEESPWGWFPESNCLGCQ